MGSKPQADIHKDDTGKNDIAVGIHFRHHVGEHERKLRRGKKGSQNADAEKDERTFHADVCGMEQGIGEVFPAETSAAQSVNKGTSRAYGTGFGGTENSAEHAAQHEDDETDHGDELVQGTDFLFQRYGSPFRSKFRMADGDDAGHDAEEQQQREPGKETCKKESSDGLFRYDGIEDEAHARGDKDAQCSACCETCAGKGAVVLVALHFGKSDGGHGESRGKRVTADGGKARASAQPGYGQASRILPEPETACGEQRFPYLGMKNEFPHEYEHGNDGIGIIHGGRRHGQEHVQALQRRQGNDHQADDARDAHGGGDGNF